MPSSVGMSSAEERGIALLILDTTQGLSGKDFSIVIWQLLMWYKSSIRTQYLVVDIWPQGWWYIQCVWWISPYVKRKSRGTGSQAKHNTPKYVLVYVRPGINQGVIRHVAIGWQCMVWCPKCIHISVYVKYLGSQWCLTPSSAWE